MKLRDFRLGWRTLVKEPAYSAVVVFGMAVGIAACFLLLGFVRHSFSYDEQVPERERVYQLQEYWNLALLGGGWFPEASLPARDAVRASGQPVLVSAFLYQGLDVRAGVHVESLNVGLADPDFEKIFAPQVLAGDLHAALTRPDALALARTTALKLFGRADVVGAVLHGNRQTYVVAAVVADQPAASTMPFDALSGMGGTVMRADMREIMSRSWGLDNGKVYVKLLPGADRQAILDTVRRGLRQSPLVRRDYAEQVAALGGRDLIEYRLRPLAGAYLDPDVKEEPAIHGNRQGVLGLAAVALLILLLAGTNYVNLATVRTLARQREIAMRKVLGASARAVARQFLAESVLVCLIATALGLLLAWLVLPLFSDLVQRRFDNMFSLDAIALTLLLGVLLGLAAGAYPTWSAMKVRATAALAGRAGSETARGLWLRRALTALQFGVAMGLTATTLAVAWQTRYTTSLDPGFDPAPLLMFAAASDMRDPQLQAFRDALARLPGVAGVAESQMPFSTGNNIVRLRREGGDAADLNQYAVSPEFFGVYGVKPVAGRLFAPARDRLVINAAAARKLGFATPQDAVGKTLGDGAGGANPRQIVGVAPDMRHRSARGPAADHVHAASAGWHVHGPLQRRRRDGQACHRGAVDALLSQRDAEREARAGPDRRALLRRRPAPVEAAGGGQRDRDRDRRLRHLRAGCLQRAAAREGNRAAQAAWRARRRDRRPGAARVRAAGRRRRGGRAAAGLDRPAALPGHFHGTGADRRLDHRRGAAAGLGGDAGLDPAPYAGRGADPPGAGAARMRLT
ncbi:hypothetical protein AM586_01440 [Massilia sp. WG5]|nr:hypothetical protein AM586_01440 [Massilia sp. WG5]